MKLLLLAGTAFLGLVAIGAAVRAEPIDFNYTGSLVDFTVPTTGSYQILALGAQGGGSSEGLGAEIGGDFSLMQGETLEIAVGGAGMAGGGGGCGTFVVGPDNVPLVIAGGAGEGIAGGAGGIDQNGGSGGNAGNGGQGGGPGGGGGTLGQLGGSGGGGSFFSAGGDGGGNLAPGGAAAPSQILLEGAAAAFPPSTSTAGTGALVAAEAGELIQVEVEAAALAVAEVAHLAVRPLVVAVAVPSTPASTRSWRPISRLETAKS